MHTRVTPSIVLACFAALAAPSMAQGGLRDALPTNTILFVSAPDIDTSVAEMQDMPLMRMWREAEVQDFFADALKWGEEHWNGMVEQGRAMHEQGMLPFTPDELMKLRVGGLGFAVTGLAMTEGERGPLPKVGVVMHMDFGQSAATWNKVIGFGLQALEGQARGELTRETFTVGDTEVISLVPAETEMSLNVAFVGNGMVFGTVRDEVKGVLEHLASGDKRLSASAKFNSAFSRLDTSGAEMEVFMQPGPVLDFAMTAMRAAAEEEPDFAQMVDIDGVGRAIDALGLRGMQSMAGTSVYAKNEVTGGSKCVSRSFVDAPAATRTGLMAGNRRDLDTAFLKWVPKDVASFSAATFDLQSVYDALMGAVKAYDENMAENLMGMLAMYEEQFGLKLEADLIGSIGDEVITWSMPMAALGAAPEMAILLKVKDQDKLLKTLQTVSQLTDGVFEIDQSERRGMTVYSIVVNWDPTGGMGINPLDMFSPTFAFKDGYLVAGFSTGDVKRVFKRMDREDDPSGDIRSNAEFAPYLEQLPKGMNSVSFADWKANFEGIYQMLTSLAAFVPVDEDIPIDLSLLPDVSTLTQHLFGSVSWSTTSEDGFHSVSVGPWGPETIALFGTAVGAGVGVATGMQGQPRMVGR